MTRKSYNEITKAHHSIGLVCDSCGGAIGGQTTRNKETIRYFQKRGIQVNICDTYGLGRRKYIFLYYKLRSICKNNKDIIIVQARHAKIYIWPLLVHFKKKYGNRFFEMVVGGDDAQYLPSYPQILRAYEYIDKVYVETFLLKKQLQQIGIKNVVRMPSCIPVTTYVGEDIQFDFGKPLPICTLSRVCKEKGIEAAMEAVRLVHEKKGRQIYHLDIYGPIEKGYETEFAKLRKEYVQEATYQGFLDENLKIEKLHEYYLFLFLTEHKGEGFPAMLIDVFSAGVPVVCSNINAIPEIVEHERLGFVAHSPYVEQAAKYLAEAFDMPEKVYAMRKAALEEAPKYDIDVIWEQLWQDIMEP